MVFTKQKEEPVQEFINTSTIITIIMQGTTTIMVMDTGIIKTKMATIKETAMSNQTIISKEMGPIRKPTTIKNKRKTTRKKTEVELERNGDKGKF